MPSSNRLARKTMRSHEQPRWIILNIALLSSSIILSSLSSRSSSFLFLIIRFGRAVLNQSSLGQGDKQHPLVPPVYGRGESSAFSGKVFMMMMKLFREPPRRALSQHATGSRPLSHPTIGKREKNRRKKEKKIKKEKWRNRDCGMT